MSKAEMEALLHEEIARWPAYTSQTEEVRERWWNRAIELLEPLLDGDHPWPRIRSCLRKVLVRTNGSGGYPSPDRIHYLVSDALAPSTTVPCRDCVSEGGIGLYADAPKQVHDAVYGVRDQVNDGAPYPTCKTHYEIRAYHLTKLEYERRGLGMELPLPDGLRNRNGKDDAA